IPLSPPFTTCTTRRHGHACVPALRREPRQRPGCSGHAPGPGLDAVAPAQEFVQPQRGIAGYDGTVPGIGEIVATHADIGELPVGKPMQAAHVPAVLARAQERAREIVYALCPRSDEKRD